MTLQRKEKILHALNIDLFLGGEERILNITLSTGLTTPNNTATMTHNLTFKIVIASKFWNIY